MCSPSAPPAPDYTGAAQAQGAANVDAARATAKLSNPNIINPYGQQTVQYGLGGDQDVPTVTQSLSPQGQQLFDTYQGVNQKLGDVAGQGVGFVQDTLNKPFDWQSVPKAPVNPGQSYQDAAFSRLQPNMDQARSATETQLANQGITRGSNPVAWDNAQREMNQRESDQRAAIATSSVGQDQAARSAAVQEQEFGRTEPLNILNAVRSSAPVNLPQFQQYTGAQVAPPPTFGAAQAAGNYGMQQYGVNSGIYNNMMSGLFSLGGAGIKGAAA